MTTAGTEAETATVSSTTIMIKDLVAVRVWKTTKKEGSQKW